MFIVINIVYDCLGIMTLVCEPGGTEKGAKKKQEGMVLAPQTPSDFCEEDI